MKRGLRPNGARTFPARRTGDGMKRGVYVASKVRHATIWQSMRDDLGVPIIATWIDEAGDGQTADFRDLAERCIREATQAAVFILYCESHEIMKGALIEVGAALAAGVPVYCVGTCMNLNSKTFTHHPLWHTAESVREALTRSGIEYDFTRGTE